MMLAGFLWTLEIKNMFMRPHRHGTSGMNSAGCTPLHGQMLISMLENSNAILSMAVEVECLYLEISGAC